ncbi:outer membrane protein assembly factor BamE [Parvibaculum sp.]|jgi:outer membrane protein assembly factor BamE (lipoprotein component of BamABCDE complex)|uniref:outer membrane protein assembly factor BamE n=1 Tax=Parvibaculum sp. TaxID=2024848 RepID=UPI000C47CA2F|nr:outer membrane protein assembly factor BamE [Parvibaculum sp.]HAC60473.1 outer membrane protein assembly factor BamE [Rhodobiaceae bacterium]MAU60491.1 cell envelope protein SmpA [Parvibaculum sp.]MBO6669323.1 outer membrane protein assembly factor BamE [Parvibaculum sp.]MBO6693021.1 outer membrane protein assembly factor BamE [Parvibaculum sp.]MBO6715024.1 outer membrane protein assembly factor BamE [Parvibaculum sp.]|tara:strand:- start:6217 stop:6723 length:507 start_codon:yes stop_codon:yes gene_type:complete
MNSFRLRRPARVALTAVCLALGSVAMSACSPIVEERGYIFDPADLDKLQTGSSKEQVRSVMGSPSTVSTVDGEAWYYISSKFETVAFYEPKEIERTVAAVYFDKTDVVQQVAYYGLEDGQIVNFVDRKTPTRGKELTVLGQLFGNLGRFNNQSTGIPSVGTGNPTNRR